MGNQQQSLLEVMEQQCISIAKGGVVCSLPCKTTVVAAANPCGGHYDKSKTVSENLKISGPLLSRFDLLFILLDNPDEELDYKLSSHIILLHSNKSSNSANKLYVNKNESSMRDSANGSVMEESEKNMLLNRLKMDPNQLQDFEPIIPSLLRKVKLMFCKGFHDQKFLL
jgi:DNA helicase MCM8